MEASRLQGLAVRPSCNFSGFLNLEQLQFIPGNGLQKFTPGLVMHHGKRSRNRGTLVRAIIAPDVAAVAVAAATVLPVCWIYMSRLKNSPSPAAASFSPSVTETLDSAGLASKFSKSSTVLAEPPILSTPKGSAGSATTVPSEEFAENLIDPSLEKWRSDSDVEVPHEDKGSLSGSDTSKLKTIIDELTQDQIESSEELVLLAAVAEIEAEEVSLASPSVTAGTSSDTENADGSFELTSSCELNGTPSSSEVETRENSTVEQARSTNGKVGGKEDVSVPFSDKFDLEKLINGAVRVSYATEATNSDNLKHEGLDLQEGTPLDENAEIHTEDGSEFSTRLQSIIQRELTNIEEKRAELEKALSSVSDVSSRNVIAPVERIKPRQLQKLPKATEVLTSKLEQNKTTNGKPKVEQNSTGRKVPIRLSDVLPIDESSDPDRYLKVFRALLGSGRLQDCVILLEEMNKASILDTGKIHHARFFKACQSQKAVREAFRFTLLISRTTLSTYNMLLSVCRDARDVDGGLRALSAAEKSGHKPDTILYTSLISTCAKAGRLDVAFKVFHEMETAGVKANIQTYGSLIDGCARAGQISKAFGVYGIMLSKSVKPDRAIFNTLINACGRAGAIERAFDVLADMKAEPCFLEPNHVTFGALISACARAGQVERAFEVYGSMRKGTMKGTPECYTAAVHACSQTGDLDLARTVLEDMKTDGVQPDEIFFSALIDVAGHANEVDGALQILEEMTKLGLVPKAITYSAVMGMCSNTGKWERALKVYEEIRHSGLVLSASTYNALITALSDGKQIHQAFAVLDEMKGAGVKPDQITYSILLEACETLDEPDRAFDLYTNAKSEGVVPNQAMCESVVGICYTRLRRRVDAPEYTRSIGLVTGVTSEAPYEQWTTWALSVYRQTVSAGVTPTITSLSLLLGCLRKREAQREKSIFDDNMFSQYDASKDIPSSILDHNSLYDPRALILYEEAASIGIVPRFNYTAGPMTLNAEIMPSYVAEVSLLTLLKGLKKRHFAGAQLYPVTITHFVEKKQTLTATREVKELAISGRSGQVMAALLRRLKLHYQGHESSGRLRIAVASIRKWLKPTSPLEFPGGIEKKQGLGTLGPRNVFVAKGIAEQQRAIRTGEGSGMDFKSTRNPSTDIFLKQISQVRDWDFGNADFEAEQDNFVRKSARSTPKVNGVKRPQSMIVNAVKDATRNPRS